MSVSAGPIRPKADYWAGYVMPLTAVNLISTRNLQALPLLKLWTACKSRSSLLFCELTSVKSTIGGDDSRDRFHALQASSADVKHSRQLQIFSTENGMFAFPTTCNYNARILNWATPISLTDFQVLLHWRRELPSWEWSGETRGGGVLAGQLAVRGETFPQGSWRKGFWKGWKVWHSIQ